MYIFPTIIFASFVVAFSRAHNYNSIPGIYIPDGDIIVNTNKGFVLERIGSYSGKFDKAIIHTFVPLHHVCTFAPANEVCSRMSHFNKRNSVELGTILSENGHDHLMAPINRRHISTLVRRHVNSMLSSHTPGSFVANITSNFHLFENEFYVVTRRDIEIEEAYRTSDQKNQEMTEYYASDAPSIILEQVKSRRIGFGFLNDEEINVILRPVMSAIDASYKNQSVKRLFVDFRQLIVSQTINAFRSCSFDHDDPVHPACLIISTLFLRPSVLPIDLYTVYHLHPLAINLNGFEYTYANLPKTIGFNKVDRALMIFDDQYHGSKCTFSKLIQCSEAPMPISSSKYPCLSELLDIDSTSTSLCDIARRHHQQTEISRIVQNIWAFNVLREHQYCESLPATNKSSNTIIINEPTILQLPCALTLRCSSIEIASSHCDSSIVLVNSNEKAYYQQQSNFRLPLEQLTSKFLSVYNDQLHRLLDEMQHDGDSPIAKRLLEKSIGPLQSLVLFFIMVIVTIVGRLVGRKLQQRVDTIERQIHKLVDIFLPNGLM